MRYCWFQYQHWFFQNLEGVGIPEMTETPCRNEADGIVEVLNPHTGFILNRNRKNDDNTEMSENKDNTENKSSFVSCISPQALAESFGRNPDYEKKLEEILDYFRMLTPEI